MTQIAFAQLQQLTDAEFTAILSDIFEHSAWVAERTAPLRPFDSVRSLHQAMVKEVGKASQREQIALICAHPDLAGKAALAGDLTQASKSEQAGVGLDRLSEEEYAEFHRLNDAYKSKFDFPFIIAVKGHTKESILQAFEARLENERDEEQLEALKQISEIARFRLEAMLCHDQEA